MKRLILIVLAIVICSPTAVFAQQAGDNVNVLPVVPPVDRDGDGEPDDPNWWKLGDGYLQRQVEPTIAASTLNPDHLLAFFNDYRAVDVVEGDVGLGEGEFVSAALKMAKILLPLPISSMLPKMELVPPINAAEAWIGGSRSYDGGITWSGFFLPGAPWDDPPSPATLAAPIYGLEAATDPVLAPGPCGTFYLVFVAFTRGGESKMVVARYRDTNDLEGGDTLVYEGMTVVESGNNPEYGTFLDKPDIAVDIMRPVDSGDECAHRVYVSYSTFNGLTKDEKIQTKINFASSEDGGLTFTKSKIQMPFNQNQGSAIAIDPRPGMPNTTGGGTVYMVWRHFFEPDAIVMTKTLDFGKRWTKSAALTGDPPLEEFDQPTISTTALIAQGFADPTTENPETAFRTNGFPTAEVAPHSYNPATGEWDATVFVAWQERVDIDPSSPTRAEPMALHRDGNGLVNGSPRIVMIRSVDEGLTWQGFDEFGSESSVRRAVDLFERTEPFDPSLDVPASESRPTGPQVQPKLSVGPGRLMVAYYESRGRIITDDAENETIDSNPFNVDDSIVIPYISGYNRVMDFRTTLLNPADGAYVSSAQISRYPIKAGAEFLNGTQNLEDVAAVNPPCSPDFNNHPVFGSPDLPPCVRQVNRAAIPQSSLGTAPFIGDYPDLVPVVQFVNDNGNWRWAIEPEDVPYRGFRTIWTDNRHLIPATQVDPEATYATYVDPDADATTGDNIKEWEKYQSYGPPGIGGACFNPGSRNTDVLTSRVDTELIVSAPTTYKQLDAPRSFPFSVRNTSGEFRRFSIAIATATDFASLSPIDPLQDNYEVVIFPYSESSLTVYVEPPGGEDPTAEVGPIRVEVELVASRTDPGAPWVPCSECPTAALTFNSDPDSAPVQNLVDDFGDPVEEDFGPVISNAFVINYIPENAFVINDLVENGFVDNAFVINEGEENAFVINEGEENAFVINAFVINAFVINTSIYEITDTVWTMSPSESNTAATYLPLINIDNAKELEGYYAFQLIVDKTTSYGSVGLASDDACSTLNVSQQQILSNVVQAPGDPNDPGDPAAFVINDYIENAFVINSEVENAFVINSAFALPPAPDPGAASKATKNGAINDSSTRAPLPPNEVRITLRAFQLVPDEELPIDEFTGEIIKYNPNEHPATIAVFHQACNPDDPDDICVAKIGADLVIADTIDTSDLSAPPCGTVDFPGFTLQNIGNADAIPRSGTMHHGIYLSDDEILDLGVDRLLTPPGEDIPSTINPLAGQFDPRRDDPVDPLTDPFEESFGPAQVTLPPDVTGGEYYLILYVDYPREASEYDETNNTVAIKLIVESSYVFQGLASPLIYDNIHSSNAGSAVPLKWQYLDPATLLPTDSSGADPVITFNGWTGDCSIYDPTSPTIVSFETDEDPGSSGLRYSDGEWQFNWQTKYPDGDPNAGNPLPSGCYEIVVFSSFTCESQGDGPFLVELN